ncbi:hypothetical protein Tco_0232962 [Tanacetum coccineum]
MQLEDDVPDFPRGGQSSLRRAEENKATTMMSHIRKDMMASSEKEVSRGSSFHKSSNNYDVPQKQRYDNRQPYLHLQDEDTDEDDQKITRKMTKKRNKKLILYNQKNMARMSAQLHMVDECVGRLIREDSQYLITKGGCVMREHVKFDGTTWKKQPFLLKKDIITKCTEMSARNKKNRAANEIPTTVGTRSATRRIDISNLQNDTAASSSTPAMICFKWLKRILGHLKGRSAPKKAILANESLHKQVEHERKRAEASKEKVEQITDICTTLQK